MKKRFINWLVMNNYEFILDFLRIMKIFSLLFILGISTVLAGNSYSQNTKLSVQVENGSIVDIFDEIQNQSEFVVFYKDIHIDTDKKVSVNLKDKNVEEILNIALEGSKLKYEILDRQIVIIPGKGHSYNFNQAVQQPIKVTGKVTDDKGESLPGASIVIRGTTTGTVTDYDGNFSIDTQPDAVLQIRYVGYRSVDIDVEGRTVINVTLEADMTGIDEIVVIGYGVSRKSDLTGSVASVDGEDFENIPASRVDQILQGKASGVQVTQTNGAPGSGSTIRIRGGNSIQGNNEPLYVIDGFIVGNDFNLNNINVNDIESLEVLKDATAIAIYGTRGANGVIMITTKTGQSITPGQPTVTVNAYHGIQELKSTIDLVNGPQLAMLSNLDAENRGAALPFPDMNAVPDIDWIDQVTRTAPMSNVDLAISGASESGKVNYYVSGNFFDQEGIIRNSGIQRYIFRTNLDVKLSDKISMGVRLNVTHHKKENNKVNLSHLWREGLTARAIYNEDGSFTSRNPVTSGTQRNAEADIQLRVDHQFVTNILGNAYFQYQPIEGLILRSSIGPKINNFKRNRYLPGTLPERLVSVQGGEAIINSNMGIDVLNENTATYMKQINDNHKFDVLAGFTWQTFSRESYEAIGDGYTNDALQFNNIGIGDNPELRSISSDYTSFQLVSWLGRFNYSFKEKYLMTLVGRVDGSSRFAGSDNEYAFFPSGAVAWRLIEEPWIKSLGVFDNLKLRTSYGKSGSQAIGSYRTLAELVGYNMYFNGSEQAGVRNGRPASPALKWETTEQLDVGLEAAFLGGRLSVEMDYYYKKTKDLLLNVEIPRQTGFPTKLQNLGSVQNQGIELMINTLNIKKGDFSWETTLTLAGNRSEVLDIGNSDFLNIVQPTNQGGQGARLYVGEPLPVFVGVEYLGVWKSQQEIDESGMLNQMVGGPRFKDTDGDLVISENDFVVIGNPEPDFYGGLMNTFKYKNLQLDIYLNGSYGNDLFNSLTQQALFFREGSNSYTELLDHWDAETNPDSNIPMPGTSQSLAYIKNNTLEIEDGSYLRIKNIRLSYDVPARILRKTNWIKNLNVYFSGTNLALFSKNRLFDPEVSRYSDNHNTRIGFTQGEYPYARTLTVGLKAEF